MFGDRLIRVAHHAFVLLLVVWSAIALTAQTVVDPRFVEFAPSADHSTLAPDGTPLVQRYSLTVFVVGSTTPLDTMNLGKPTPSAGIIRVDFLPLMNTPPPAGVILEARVTAIGPGGSTPSAVSNQFSFQSTCSPNISSTSASVGAGTSSGSVGVTAGTGCTWSAVSNANWVTLTGATSGTGNGTVPYSVAANTSTAVRTGTLTVAGKTYTITQAGAACSYAIAPTSQSVVAGGGTGSTSVTAQTGCAWTAVSNNTSWLTVTAGASGSGNGSVSFSAAANASTSQRTGTLTAGGRTFTVTQAGAACAYAIAPTSQSVVAGGGTGSTSVTAQTGCAWTAVSDSTSWLTVTAGASGSGNGTVSFSAAANVSTSQRTGSLTVGGQAFTVTQAGAACSYAISPTSQSVIAGGGTGSTSVTAQTGCAWTAVSNSTSWLTVTAGASGSGNGTVIFSAAANATTSPRTGTLTIGGQTFTVDQAAVGCNYTITPTAQNVSSSGGSPSTVVATTTGCAWTAASNTAWLTLTSGASGTANGTVTFSVASNTTSLQRTATATIAGQTFTVTQDPAGCTFSISPTSQSVAAAGATGSTTLTAAPGCSWSASSSFAWLTITSSASGSGSGTVTFTVAPNAQNLQRVGTFTVAGKSFTVTQAANTCSYVLTPTSTTVLGVGGSGSFTVATASGCVWAATTNQSWITASGSGTASGSVSFTVAANPGTTSRVGAISIGSQVFTVVQNAGATTLNSTTVARPRGLRVIVGGSQ